MKDQNQGISFFSNGKEVAYLSGDIPIPMKGSLVKVEAMVLGWVESIEYNYYHHSEPFQTMLGVRVNMTQVPP